MIDWNDTARWGQQDSNVHESERGLWLDAEADR